MVHFMYTKSEDRHIEMVAGYFSNQPMITRSFFPFWMFAWAVNAIFKILFNIMDRITPRLVQGRAVPMGLIMSSVSELSFPTLRCSTSHYIWLILTACNLYGL